MERFELKLSGVPELTMATCRMVNPLTTLSIVCLYVETLLIAYVAAQLNTPEHRTFFSLYVLVIAVSFVLTNTSSALMVKTSMDFNGKYIGRVLCFALHLCQLSLVWRFGKLVFLYDKKDWFELANLRLIHVAIQTVPFISLQGYLVLSTMTIHAVSLLSLCIAVVSAAISLTMFCVRDQLHACSWEDVSETKTSSTKRFCGVFLFLLGTVLALATRFACIALMALVVSYFVLIPLGFHMLFLMVGYLSCKAVKSEAFTLKEAVMRVGLSYLNIFDLAETDILTVQCKYVSFYTAILVENIVMVAVWLLLSEVDYITKLIVIVIILAVFICAMVLKFTSCGFFSTLSSVQLIPAETPDSPTIIEGNKIMNGVSPIPSVSSSVPHIKDSRRPYDTDPSAVTVLDTLDAVYHSSRSSQSPRTVGNNLYRTRADLRVQSDPRASDTDYGTYRIGTHDSVSIDDPTRVSRYASHESSLNRGLHSGPKKGHHSTTALLSRKARTRSDISLDICSSNSRNTNTLVTSVVATSETSAAQTPQVNTEKCVSPRRKTTLWQKMNLRLPSVSNFLVRLDRAATLKENNTKKVKPNTTASSEALEWNETPPTNAETGEISEQTDVYSKAASPSLTDLTNSTAVCVGTPTMNVRKSYPHQVPSKLLTNEDRVKLWLANIYGSQPVLNCQCSSESHSSDCTYVYPPKTHRQKGMVKFKEFLAQIPPHPEASHFQTKPGKYPPAKPPRRRKPISQQVKASSEMNLNHVDQLLDNDNIPVTDTAMRGVPDASAPRVSGAPMCKHKQALDSELKKTLELKYGRRVPKPLRHRRSFSETCSDSTATFQQPKTRLREEHRPRSKEEPIVPFVIKLSAMESLV